MAETVERRGESGNGGAPEPCDILVRNGYILTLDERRTVYPSGAVAIRGNRIAAVGRRGTVAVPLTPGKVSTFSVPASGVRYVQSYAYVMSARSSEGFVPHFQDVQSKDYRNLGALMRFHAVTVDQQTP